MGGFVALLIALFSLIYAISYWISWEMQPQYLRRGFAMTLWNDIARRLRRQSGAKSAAEAQAMALQNNPPMVQARIATGE